MAEWFYHDHNDMKNNFGGTWCGSHSRSARWDCIDVVEKNVEAHGAQAAQVIVRDVKQFH